MIRVAFSAIVFFLFAGASNAQDLTIKGALAQGFVYADGINYYGSSNDVSTEFSEVALNARYSPSPALLLSGQLNAREAGSEGERKLNVDYALLDWRFFQSPESNMGVRIGKVKHPYGFHNDTRDVVFSRPGVLMPASVYFEGNGFRNVLFSAEGVQTYANWNVLANPGEITLGVARRYTADFDAEIREYSYAQLLQNWDAAQVRFGLSYLGAEILSEAAPGFGNILIGTDSFVASAQKMMPQSTLTFEYRYSETKVTSMFGADDTPSDGAYIEYRRYQQPSFQWYLRYEALFSDRNDRSGRQFERSGAGAAEQRFGYYHAAGVAWFPTSSVGVFVDYQYVDGNGAFVRDEQRIRDRYWQVASMMIAYRF